MLANFRFFRGGLLVFERRTPNGERFLKIQRFSGLQYVDLGTRPFCQPGKLLRITSKRWKCAVVNGNDALWRQKLHCPGCVLGPHREVVPNWQQRQVQRCIFSNQAHVRKKSGVAGVINCLSFRLNDDSGGFTQVQRTTSLFDHR